MRYKSSLKTFFSKVIKGASCGRSFTPRKNSFFPPGFPLPSGARHNPFTKKIIYNEKFAFTQSKKEQLLNPFKSACKNYTIKAIVTKHQIRFHPRFCFCKSASSAFHCELSSSTLRFIKTKTST